jgi:hypothetical protein
MQDRNNPREMMDCLPAGLSQISNLPGQDGSEEDDGDWEYAMEEVSDAGDYDHSQKVLSRHYNELSEAFNNSKQKESLEVEFMQVMNDFIIKARGSAAIVSTTIGNRVSMLPASSNRKKTHGTSHY